MPAAMLFASKFDYDTARYRRSFFLGLPTVIVMVAAWFAGFLVIGQMIETGTSGMSG